MKKTKSLVCPHCRSTAVSRDWSNPLVGVPNMYTCDHCGHTTYQLLEIDADKAAQLAPKTTHSKSQKVDVAYGEFEVRFWWKIAGPTLLLLGLFVLTQEPIAGIALLIPGAVFTYFTYFKKRALRD